MPDFNDPTEIQKLFKKRKGWLDLLKEKTPLYSLGGNTPKRYNRFDQGIGAVNFDIIRGNNPVKQGAREEQNGGVSNANPEPLVTTTTYRSFFETRVQLSGSQFRFSFSDPYGDTIDASSFSLTNNANLSASFTSDTVVEAMITSSVPVGTYNYTGSISNGDGDTTLFSDSFEIFSGSLIQFYTFTSINHSSSAGSGSERNLQSPIWDMSGSQFKEYVAGYVSKNGGSSNRYIEQSHIPILGTDQFYQSDLDFETTGRTKLIEEPTTGDLLIISGTSGGGFDVPGNKDHAVVYRVGNTGSTPPITRDGSDGLPVLTSW